MIDETLQDQAALHALGMLHGVEATAFQAALVATPELQRMVNEIAETAAAITRALPAANAPSEILPRLLTQIRSERMHGPVSPAQAESAGFNWMPWALAASIAIAAGAGFLAGAKVTSVNSAERITQLSSKMERGDAEQQRLAAIIAALNEERVAMEKRVSDLRQRDAIFQVRIATLKVQKTALEKAYANVAAFVIWDASGQNGVMRFDKLPQAAAGKVYQMWAIDPRYQAPVSAGVFSAEPGREFDVKFKPTREIATAGKFAVSIEQPGGAASPLGPIVLMSN